MNKKLIFLFPGHGNYDKNMIKNLYENFSIIRNTINYSSRILGFNLIKIINNDKKINNTLYLQVIITVMNVSIWRLWNQKKGIFPIIFLGHSLGEYTSFICNNNISFKNFLFLIKKRALLMFDFFKKKKMEMIVLLNIDINIFYSIFSKLKCDYNFYISVINSKKQIVISVENKDIDFFLNFFKFKKIKFFVLNLKIASHCFVIFDLSKEFKKLLIKNIYNFGKSNILHNLNVNYCLDKNQFLSYIMTNHLYKQMNWIESLKYIEYTGIKNVIECGCNQVLKKIIENTSNIICKKINNYYDFKKNLQKY